MTDALATIRVLLVEDDEGTATLLRRMLRESLASELISLRHASNLTEALSHLESKEADVVFLDLGLPDSQGLETLIRLHRLWPELAIVVVTALASEEMQIAAVEYGAQDYLVKGCFEAVLLRRSIHYAIGRKRSEVQLRRAKEEAEEANRSKGNFLASVSHEIRSPMNAIIGFSELLAEESLTEQQEQYVGIIREAAENLLGLINDILDLSKMEAGRLTLEPERFRLEDLLEGVYRLFQEEARRRGVQLEIERSAGLPADMVSDAGRLRQCLVNLVSNALKFTEQGYVRLTVEETQEAGERRIRFMVSDTGIGIPASQHASIFETFVQADGSTTRRFGGTGLGLAITRDLAELLGGSVWVESEEGRGSTFTLEIPLETCEETAQATSASV